MERNVIMKKLLVAGGSYFIGRKIVDIMMAAGYDVYTLNRGTVPPPCNVTNLACDRNDPLAMREVLKDKQFSVIIDVSGLNRTQAEILCDCVDIKSLKKFVFISSSAVYDIENLAVPFKETDPLGCNKYWTDYGQNKIEAEDCYAGSFHGTQKVFLRPAYVFGENNYAQRESFVFEHLVSGKQLLIPATNPKLQFIYAGDFANIILRLLDINLGELSIFNVGNHKPVTAREWVEHCAAAVGLDVDIILYDYLAAGWESRDFFPFYDYDNVLDVAKLRSVIQYETDFEQNLRAAYGWFLKNRGSIVFKGHVAKNEETILRTLAK